MAPVLLKITFTMTIAVGTFTLILILQDSLRQSNYTNSWNLHWYAPESKPYKKRIYPSRQEQYDSYGHCSANATFYFPKRSLISIANQSIPPLLPNYKNPCWAESNTTITCIPYVILAGFPKCASTDLHARLNSHPLMVSSSQKEPHFLTLEMYKKDPCPQNKPKNPNQASCLISEYAHTWFWRAARVIQGKAKKDVKKWSKTLPPESVQREFERIKEMASTEFEHPMITIDGSTSFAWYNDQWRKLEENQGCVLPRALNSDLIVKMNPNIKIIMIMREPVERLYSDYFYMNKENATTENFHNLTVDFLQSFKECLQTFSFTKCMRMQRRGQELRPHIGIYHFHIRDWLRRTPRDQFLFLHSESYHNDITGVLRKTFDFLDLPSLSDQAMKYISEMREHNINRDKPKTMYPETRALLNKFYAEHNRQLADLLGDDRFLWKN